MERKLAAILHADVKGYSRLMGEDEETTLRTLTAYRDEMDAIIRQHRGRVVGSAGDSVLAEFASVVDAVQCVAVIQATLKAENASLPLNRRMEFRIGINLGDVMVQGEQIYGDGVNIAARLESLSDGLTEDLTTDLSKFSGLFVIARTSAFTYKGKAGLK
jgi:class 3 adenylate cyclase